MARRFPESLGDRPLTVTTVRSEEPWSFADLADLLTSYGLDVAWECAEHPGADLGLDGKCPECHPPVDPAESYRTRHTLAVGVARAFRMKPWQLGVGAFSCSCHPGPMPGMAEYHRRRKHRNRRRR